MKFRHLSFSVLAAASFAFLAQATADEPAPAPAQSVSISKALAPTLKNVQNAVKAKDYALASQELAKAEAMPNKSEFDENVIGQFRKTIDAHMSRAAK